MLAIAAKDVTIIGGFIGGGHCSPLFYLECQQESGNYSVIIFCNYFVNNY